MTEPVTQGAQELHNTVVGTLQAENKQYTHNSLLCKPETEENRLDSQEIEKVLFKRLIKLQIIKNNILNEMKNIYLKGGSFKKIK